MNFLTQYPQYVTLFIFAAFSIPIVICDIKSMLIPDILLYLGSIVLLCYRFACTRSEFLIYLVTAAVSVVLFIIIRVSSKKGLGTGDIKYSAMCALYAGPAVLFAGFLIASLSGLIFYFVSKSIMKRRILKSDSKSSSKRHKFAFTPFMALGTLITGILPLLKFF